MFIGGVLQFLMQKLLKIVEMGGMTDPELFCGVNNSKGGLSYKSKVDLEVYSLEDFKKERDYSVGVKF